MYENLRVSCLYAHVSRSNNLPQNPALLNRELELVLDTLGSFIKAQEPLSKLWFAANIYDEVLSAIKRQKAKGDKDASLDVYAAGYTVFT